MIKNLDLLKEVSFNQEKDLQEANRMLIEVQKSDLPQKDKELKTKVLKDIIRNIKEVF
ncbi:hypothetical protein [Halarcobacter bivalviorum]|uniref:Uncharacterized protein n=1 Tax=Halarcobacter bivalviorum TaxID=663364 RepID=A0AB33GLK5_9BACT|nr:hypothetical protein [Halarcobacter bivalviorum]AXH12224.1 hypothetical protein ABIV_1224 [Halarcobacter bivalviorum]